MKIWMTVVSIASLIWVAPAMAEDTLTLERVFASPSINGPSPRQVKLSPDGTLVTSLRPREDDRERFDLWAMDTTTGQWRILVDSTKLGTTGELSEAEKMQRERARIGGSKGIVAYDWAPDSKSILVPVDGDIFIADLKGQVKRLTDTSSGELDATVSPAGKFVSFVRDQNLFVHDRATGQERKLTSDGGDTVSWGVAEFVAQEEMGRTRGHWWSPDDSRLAVARVDEHDVQIVSRAAIGADGTKVYQQRYPKAGTPNAKVDLYIMRADGSEAFKLDLDDEPDYYLARVDWAPDGKSLYIQWENRAQTKLYLLKADIATRKILPIIEEDAKTWINLHDNFRALKDGSLLWSSERSGFSHLYRWKSGKLVQLTSGDWEVKSVVGVDQARGRIFFTGNRDEAIEQHLYAVDISAPGKVHRITDAGWWVEATMNKTATRAIVRRANPNQPEQVLLADATGKRIAWIEENRLDAGHPYAPYLSSHVAAKFGTLKAEDGSVLQTKLLMPPVEAGKRYPVFVQVYGGPGAGRQATAKWGGALQQYLVHRGWIVFSIDGRGSPDRGKAFEDQIYHAMGSVEVADQLAGVHWLKQQPFVDPSRVVVSGGSYGGYMTLKLLEAAPGTFAAGVAVAPVTRWELYDTHYTERYMGDPAKGAADYERANALPDASKIVDPLLLIHGMADDNVVFEHTTALMAKLQNERRPFETMVYPGQTHSISGPGVSVHLWTTILDFLDRNVQNRN